MFRNTTIKTQMWFLIAIVTISLVSAAGFTYYAFGDMEGEFRVIKNKSIETSLAIYDIEKRMNYISRNDRDIMLGGDADYTLLQNSKKSTMTFIPQAYSYLDSLTPEQIANNKEQNYEKYHKLLSPLLVGRLERELSVDLIASDLLSIPLPKVTLAKKVRFASAETQN
ncbi:MAG: hypothetical protein FAF05_02130 [Epsilonproteobacteria bacterium]|nr:hypothetical protein [Campylobacterota bacterium]